MSEKYGRRNVTKMIAQVQTLRAAIQAEGTEAIQDAWGAVEEHIDYAYRVGPLQDEDPTPVAAAMAVPEVVMHMAELREVVQNISGEDSLDRELTRAALVRIDAALAAMKGTP